MGTGGIAVKNLDEKARYRDDRLKHALSPLIGDVMADLADGCGGKLMGPILLKLFDDLGNRCRHR
jgi:hypothetical protein